MGDKYFNSAVRLDSIQFYSTQICERAWNVFPPDQDEFATCNTGSIDICSINDSRELYFIESPIIHTELTLVIIMEFMLALMLIDTK